MKPTARMVYRQWLCTLFVTNLFAATASSDADQATTWNVANMKNNDHRNLATKLPTNLALNRPVVLSSVSTHTQNSSTRTGDGFRLSDGDRGTHFFQGKGCAETTTSADPWARIDFGREVPLAVVRLWTRADSSKTALSPIQLYLGNLQSAWYENLLCADNIQLSRTAQPAMANCSHSGRYLWIVLRVRGTRSAPLSLCEVDVSPKGPLGTPHVLQTAGAMWSLTLEGLALHSNDRIRIVANTIWCGQMGSAHMDSAVLRLTAPTGMRSSGGELTERWDHIQINRAGLYKVCWCGNIQDCSLDEHYAFHVATIAVNGIMMTVAGTGSAPANASELTTGSPSTQTPLNDPYGIAISTSRIYISERGGSRVRWMDVEHGLLWVLCGQWLKGSRGDGGPAFEAQLDNPMGLALSLDQRTLFIADSLNHRIRQIDVGGAEPRFGIIRNVAGNGLSGFSGDGGPPAEAQLNTPTSVAVDRNHILWICDQGNNRIRVVSMRLRVRVPGTTNYLANVILTAAGTGENGLVGSLGNGGLSTSAQFGSPRALAASSGFLTQEFGIMTSSVYVAQSATNLVRMIALDFQDYMGVANTLLGSGLRGYRLNEAVPNAAAKAHINEPSGVAADDGLVYVSDTGNNRLLMLPALEYVSLGCWRENIESPLVPSIESTTTTTGKSFLDGNPETRLDAVRKCALAALQRGYSVFAIRRMGFCATGPDAHRRYFIEGESTFCSDGRGGARDNSVYMFSRPGMSVEQLDAVYVLSGRERRAGFTGDLGPAWMAELNQPTGIAVSPVTKDILLADSNNHRLRLVFHQVGPNSNQHITCTNGFNCTVQVFGNGLQPADRLLVIPLNHQCGVPGVELQAGIEHNPVSEVQSSSFTRKTYRLGVPSVSRVGDFRLCFCTNESLVFGQATTCQSAEAFIQDVGVLHIHGPDGAASLSGRAGLRFDVLLIGAGLSHLDRVRIVADTLTCGSLGANVTDVATVDTRTINGPRAWGNTTFGLWTDVVLSRAGNFRVCWCRGQDAIKFGCAYAESFTFQAATLAVEGPLKQNLTMVMSTSDQLLLHGTGFGAGDRIRIVDAQIQCGSNATFIFSSSLDPSGTIPEGPATFLTADHAVWTGLKLRQSNPLRICWCGSLLGCTAGSDFNVDTGFVEPLGPSTHDFEKIAIAAGAPFSIDVLGTGFIGQERVRIVDAFTECGSTYALAMSQYVTSADPAGVPTTSNTSLLTWHNVVISTQGFYRVCYCGCHGNLPSCCLSGADFFLELKAIFVSISPTSYTRPVNTPSVVSAARSLVVPLPTNWSEIPKDTPKQVQIKAKTRDTPGHAGSSGPINVRLISSNGMLLPLTLVLQDLFPGNLTTAGGSMNLVIPMHPIGIEVSTETSDAWLCEYIDVHIESFSPARFPCNGWAVTPADRIVRRATDESMQSIVIPTYFPRPLVSLWERRFFTLDGCGGCHLGYMCVEEMVPLAVRLRRDQEASAAPYQATCQPVCGDGLAVPGEQCDDANVEAMDGCSSTCTIEHGFECAWIANTPSRCYPRLCDRIKGNQFSYTSADFAQGDRLGYACSSTLPMELQVPPEKPFMCYPWSRAACPRSKEQAILRDYAFSPNGQGLADCNAFEITYEGDSLDCSMTNYEVPRGGEHGYKSYTECAQQCGLKRNCKGAKFYVNSPRGGSECPAGQTANSCQASCRLAPACPRTISTFNPASRDQFHVGRKVQKPRSQFDGDFVCIAMEPPRPSSASLYQGVVIVHMDSPVALPSGKSIHQEFRCSLVLSATSTHAVGGEGSTCTWISYDTFKVALGSRATLCRPNGYDGMKQAIGDACVLEFDSSKLRPRGVNPGMPSSAGTAQVFIHQTEPLSKENGGRPQVPNVVLQGPSLFSSCGALEISADSSSEGGWRRWRQATWTCMETRPNARITSSSLRYEGYGACSRIQPILDAKSWCTSAALSLSAMLNVVQACELKVSIPEQGWCGLGFIRLKLTLTTAQGFSSSAEWTTELPGKENLPVASPVGQTLVTISPQRDLGAPLPRIQLEVATQADVSSIGHCNCNFSATPLASQGRVAVSWHIGEVINGLSPRLYEMQQIPKGHESNTPNILSYRVDPNVLKPDTLWHIIAYVTYAQMAGAGMADVPGALVRFIVRVGPVEPPSVVLRAPQRVTSRLCSFVVDASGSRVRELIRWSTPRQLGTWRGSQGRRLQNSTNLTTTDAPTTTGQLWDTPQAQSLQFEWQCRQLGVGVDDSPQASVISVAGELSLKCQAKASHLIFEPGSLQPGLYIFKAVVTDTAFPAIVGEANVTVEVTDETLPSFSVSSPPQTLGAKDTATVEIAQMGFGSCPLPAGVGGKYLLLLRTSVGLPVSSMRAVAQVPILEDTRSIAGNFANIFVGTVVRSSIQPGFMYAFRLLTADGRAGALNHYKNDLLAEGSDDLAASNARIVQRAPLVVPLGVWTTDSEPFMVLSGPSAGSLDVLQPAGRQARARHDIVVLQQVWATDYPPLEYAYYYGIVPESRRSDFQVLLNQTFDSSILSERLRALVPNREFVQMASWSFDCSVETILPSGMYVIEGRVRDAQGYINSRVAAVEAYPAWEPNLKIASAKLRSLEDYVHRTRRMIMRVRAMNRGAAAVLPVCAAADGLPDLSAFDFRSMLAWNVSSGVPSPTLGQTPFGAPIVSIETRALLISFLRDVIGTFRDIISQLDTTSLNYLGNSTRRLQAASMSTVSNVKTLTAAFRQLAKNIVSLMEPSLLLEVGYLMTMVLDRMQTSGANLSVHAGSAEDLLATISILLSGTAPAQIPRSGIIEVNVSNILQTRLSAVIMQTASKLGDAVAAFQSVNQLYQLRAPLPPGFSAFAGGLQLSILVKTLGDVISEGVTITPSQFTDRWPHPHVEIAGLGPPGFMARNWAKTASPTYNDIRCYDSKEAFLDRIAVVMVSWPSNPFVYSTGSLVGVDTNVTMPYTVQLRSCGTGIIVQDLPGSCQLRFHLDPAIVYEKRSGYMGVTPYRVTWWEDSQRYMAQTDRTRRWTTQGCQTQWRRESEATVTARCDRLPSLNSGSVFAIELVPRPPVVFEQPPPENCHIHNAITYMSILLIIRWIYLCYSARRFDKKFGLVSNQDVEMKMHFAPAEQRYHEAVKSGRIQRHQLSFKEKCLKRLRSVATVHKALRGTEVFYSLEVRELACMRSGKRSSVYESFVDSLDRLAAVSKPRVVDDPIQALTLRPQPQTLPVMNDDNSLQNPRLAWADAHENRSKDAHQPSVEKEDVDITLENAMMELVNTPPQAPFTETVETAAMLRSVLQVTSGGQEHGKLPPGWSAYLSDQHGGRVYYFNEQINQTCWERPVLMSDGTVQFWSDQLNMPEENTTKEDGASHTLTNKRPKMGTLKEFAELTKDAEAPARTPSRQEASALHAAEPPPDEDLQCVLSIKEDELLGPQADIRAEPHAIKKIHTEGVHAAGVNETVQSPMSSVRQQLEHSMRQAAESTEVALPYGWDMQTGRDGVPYYVNATFGLKQWLPPKLELPWVERFSTDGQVYYLNLFDGSNQWEWPSSSPLLALPGSTGAIPAIEDGNESPISARSVADENDVTDQALALAGSLQVKLKPLSLDSSSKFDVRSQAHWDKLKETYKNKQIAHDRQYATARAMPGIRDFVRAHELVDQAGNWDKQLQKVEIRAATIERQGMALGDRAELPQPELQHRFPIIQRLLWTKWPNWVIFLRVLLREMPSVAIYSNIVRPSKFHRSLLHEFSVSFMLLVSTIMLAVPSPVSEHLTAKDTSIVQLLSDILTTEWQMEIFLVAVISYSLGRFARFLCRVSFFAYWISPMEPPPKSKASKMAQMTSWAEEARMGKWVCCLGILLCVSGTVVLCTLVPQPRSTGVARVFIFCWLCLHILGPLITALLETLILTSARKSAVFDGLLTAFPRLMDFLDAGVASPDFLAWRISKIAKERDDLRHVYLGIRSIGDAELVPVKVFADGHAGQNDQQLMLEA